MKEPYASEAFEGPGFVASKAATYQSWREIAINLPKFGSGQTDVDIHARWIVDQLFEACEYTMTNPIVKTLLDNIDAKYVKIGTVCFEQVLFFSEKTSKMHGEEEIRREKQPLLETDGKGGRGVMMCYVAWWSLGGTVSSVVAMWWGIWPQFYFATITSGISYNYYYFPIDSIPKTG